jgi:hypothetical protein
MSRPIQDLRSRVRRSSPLPTGKEARTKKSSVWRYGEKLLRLKDKREVYYCYQCERQNRKQLLYRIDGVRDRRCFLGFSSTGTAQGLPLDIRSVAPIHRSGEFSAIARGSSGSHRTAYPESWFWNITTQAKGDANRWRDW